MREPTKTVKPRPDRRKSAPVQDRWFPEHVEEKPPSTSFLAARHRTILWRL